MSISALIKKGGLSKSATVTVATVATNKSNINTTVAHAQKPLNEKRIRAWLAHIQEGDQEIINEVINRCRTSKDAREYFLKRANEVPAFVINDSTQNPH